MNRRRVLLSAIGLATTTALLPYVSRARSASVALAAHLDGAEAFFNGADVIVDLAEREISEDEVAYYRRVLEERGVVVRGFTADGNVVCHDPAAWNAQKGQVVYDREQLHRARHGGPVIVFRPYE